MPGLIRELATPASIGFFFNTMFNVVDTWYAGRFSTEALAALSLTFPVFFILVAMGNGFSTGTTALVGNALGSNDRKEASLTAAQGLVLSVMVSVVVVIVGYYSSPYLYRLLGAQDTYLKLCLDYIHIILAGCVFVFAFYMFNGILNSQGDTRSFRDYLIVASIANIILDPILMYGWLGLPSMGVKGIALATVISQGGGVIFLGRRTWRTGLLHRSSGARWTPDFRVLKDIFTQGIPAGMSMMSVALGIFVITYFLSEFGQSVVAAYGAATRIEQIVLLPALGLNVAALSLASQNSGAKRYDRIRELVRVSMGYGAIITGVGGLVLFFGGEFLMGLFTPDVHVQAVGARYLRFAAFLEFSYVVLFLNTSILQGLKKPAFSLWIGVYRQLVMPIGFFWLATRVFGLALDGIWWGIFLITWSAAIVAAYYARRKVTQLEREAAQ
ncbi:MAG: MATE family efflux transporter [bacterium]|nr:MATE family efflux transporter [bacterium]